MLNSHTCREHSHALGLELNVDLNVKSWRGRCWGMLYRGSKTWVEVMFEVMMIELYSHGSGK